eukprot:6207914-Pleurochrysis_carterae.AAC.1
MATVYLKSPRGATTQRVRSSPLVSHGRRPSVISGRGNNVSPGYQIDATFSAAAPATSAEDLQRDREVLAAPATSTRSAGKTLALVNQTGSGAVTDHDLDAP